MGQGLVTRSFSAVAIVAEPRPSARRSAKQGNETRDLRKSQYFHLFSFLSFTFGQDMIISKSHRKDKLVSHGVPIAFLDAIDNSKYNDYLSFHLSFPEGAYYYLKSIESRKIFQDFDITPLYEYSGGETFWVLLSNPSQFKFIKFGLEEDKIWKDYGDRFMLLLADLLIELYEALSELDIDDLTEIALSLGFIRSRQLFSALEEADRINLRDSFEKDKKWRQENIPLFID